MKMTQEFAVERAAAQHCPELVGRRLEDEQLGESISAFAKAMCKAWPEPLGALLLGGKIEASCEHGVQQSAQELYEAVGPLAANFVLACGSERLRVLLSLDLGCALALTDKSFGGAGTLEDREIAELPRSAAVVIEKFALALSSGFAIDSESPVPCEILCRHENLRRLHPFGADERCIAWRFTLEQQGSGQWPFTLAMRESELARFVSEEGCEPGSNAAKPGGSEIDVGGVELELHAQLAQLTLPYSRIEKLCEGAIVPVALNREVPLMCGERKIAIGRVGKADERVAIQITRTT